MSDDASLLSLARAVVDDLGTLIAGHARLARAEIVADARRYERRLAVVGVAVALLLLGYACACVAAALALASRLGLPAAFAIVGGVHLAGGGAALAVALARDTTPPFDGSVAELERTVESLATLATKTGGGRELAKRRPTPEDERIIPRGA